MRTLARQRLIVGLGLGFGAALVAALVGLAPFLETVELKTYDFRVRHTADPATARRDLVLVTIDDGSIQRLEPLVGRWPWPRLVHAQAIDFLAHGGARVIGYDVLFTEADRRTFAVGGDTWTGEESDRALAEAVARAGRVVLVADLTTLSPSVASRPLGAFPSPFDPGKGFEHRPAMVPPLESLARAAVGIGHNLLVLDPDGPVRRSVPFVEVEGRAVPSLAVALALQAGRFDPRSVKLEGRGLRVGPSLVPLVATTIPTYDGEPAAGLRQLIRFTGPVLAQGRTTYREYSFYDLFYAQQQRLAGEAPGLDPKVFADAVVLVGTTAAGLHDTFTVPFAEGKMAGVQVHANLVDNLLSGRFVRPAPRAANLAITLACALGVGLAGAYFGVAATTAVASALAAVLGGSAWWLFGQGTWIAVAVPGLALALATFGATAYQYFVEGREKRLVKQVFSRFVSRDVFAQLMADPSRARLGGERRTVTVLFADIRGFTSLSERSDASEVVAQLNEYFSGMVDVVFRHHGTVDKFVGDMVMALFGAPLDDDAHPDHAVAAALGMLETLAELNRGWAAQGRPALDIGVGINTGEMIAGNIGAESIMSYTVVGDAVNVAARLESLTKDHGCRIIISESVRRRLKRQYDVRPLGTAVVKGRAEGLAIFEIRQPGKDPT